VIQRAFFKQTGTTTFLTLKRGSQGHCRWSFVSVAPHDNDPDGNLPRYYSARVAINGGAVARRR